MRRVDFTEEIVKRLLRNIYIRLLQGLPQVACGYSMIGLFLKALENDIVSKKQLLEPRNKPNYLEKLSQLRVCILHEKSESCSKY